MTTNVTAPAAGAEARTVDPIELFRTMVTARTLNDVLKARKTQGKFPFYIGCAGHESVAAVVAALEDRDWLSFYYRDLAGWLQRSHDIRAVLRAAYSRTRGVANRIASTIMGTLGLSLLVTSLRAALFLINRARLGSTS